MVPLLRDAPSRGPHTRPPCTWEREGAVAVATVQDAGLGSGTAAGVAMWILRSWERESVDCRGAGPEAEPGAGWKFPEGRFQLSAWRSFLAELFPDRRSLRVGSEQNAVGAPGREAGTGESQSARRAGWVSPAVGDGATASRVRAWVGGQGAGDTGPSHLQAGRSEP